LSVILRSFIRSAGASGREISFGDNLRGNFLASSVSSRRLRHRNLEFVPAIGENVFMTDGKQRKDVRAGLRVAIVLKQDQRTGKRTTGTVKDLLTNSSFHPHGIKVRLTDGQVGRVQEILEEES
jgi:uncharacterized repeat protein (TIGR03833 family)